METQWATVRAWLTEEHPNFNSDHTDTCASCQEYYFGMYKAWVEAGKPPAPPALDYSLIKKFDQVPINSPHLGKFWSRILNVVRESGQTATLRELLAGMGTEPEFGTREAKALAAGPYDVEQYDARDPRVTQVVLSLYEKARLYGYCNTFDRLALQAGLPAFGDRPISMEDRLLVAQLRGWQ